MRGNLLCSVIKFPVDFDIFLPLSMRCPFVRHLTGHLSLFNALDIRQNEIRNGELQRSASGKFTSGNKATWL
jgi:hypothetical protein